MKRGIVNIGGVSCHLSCALQILCHTVVPLRDALIHLHDEHHIHHRRSDLAFDVGNLFRLLADSDTGQGPVDPTLAFNRLQLAASIDYRDVGDASTALIKVIRALKEYLGGSSSSSSSSPTATPTVAVAEQWDQFMGDLFFCGSTCQTIIGRKLINGETDHAILTRQKAGKPKPMAIPLVLRGHYESIQEGLQLLQEEQLVQNYRWTEEPCPNTEERVCQNDTQSLLETKWGLVHQHWITTKLVSFESTAEYLFLHLERFSYKDIVRVLEHESIQVSIEIVLASSEQYVLVGGIIHVIEDSVEDEGHYVTAVRNDSTDTDDTTWALIDDEQCRMLPQSKMLKYLGGSTNEKGHYLCATQLVYAIRGHENTISTKLKPLKEAISTAAAIEEELPDDDGGNPNNLIGRRLRVRWSKGQFYPGFVSGYNEDTSKHRVTYDDGDVKEYTLSKKTIEWIG